jgi:hypothetical protein
MTVDPIRGALGGVRNDVRAASSMARAQSVLTKVIGKRNLFTTPVRMTRSVTGNLLDVGYRRGQAARMDYMTAGEFGPAEGQTVR